MKIAINGVGVAGPSLAYWLLKGGHDVLMVEESQEIRSGGYVIDFWGVGYDIAEKMGIIPRLKALGYQVEEVRFVDEYGKKCGGFAADVFASTTNGRFTSLQRSDLAATIYSLVEDKVETILGDSISGIEENSDSVLINFDHAEPREVDLVIGADGLHSRVRKLVFGPEDQFEKKLGYYVAAFEVDRYEPRDELVYISHAVPGKQISRFSMRDDKTLFLFVFQDKYLNQAEPVDLEERRSTIRRIFANVKWECPKILEAMNSVSDIYFDCVSQIRMNQWTKGRVALIGDAAACVSLLAGEGTGLAMAESYVLGGELAISEDHSKAFGRYEKLMMPFLAKKQGSAAKFASSFVPGSAIGIAFRNLVTKLLNISFVAEYFVGRDLRDDINLPEYERFKY